MAELPFGQEFGLDPISCFGCMDDHDLQLFIKRVTTRLATTIAYDLLRITIEL